MSDRWRWNDRLKIHECASRQRRSLSWVCYHQRMNVRSILPLVFAAVLPGCSAGADPQIDNRSEAADLFYAPTGTESRRNSPRPRWHRSNSVRWFETKLRPTAMRARLPTAYLRMVTHNHQPWANEIWDEVYAGFKLPAMTPLPPEKATQWRRDFQPDEVVLELGGFSQSRLPTLDTFSMVYKTKVTAFSNYRVTQGDMRTLYELHDPSRRDMDDSPLTIECDVTLCRVGLTIPPRLASVAPLAGQAPANGNLGSGLRVIFHRSRLADWPAIRRMSICFAGLSIRGFSFDKVFQGASDPCLDVRKSIERTTQLS